MLPQRKFIGNMSIFATAASIGARKTLGSPKVNAADYAPLRKQLREFYPDECHGVVKDPRYKASENKIAKVTVHNLWGGKNTEVEKSSKIKLPTFKRSCAIRIDFE